MDGLPPLHFTESSRVRVVFQLLQVDETCDEGGWRTFQSKGALENGRIRGWATVRNRPKNLKLEDEKSSMKISSSYDLVIMKLVTRPNELSLWLMVDGWLMCVFLS